MRIVHVLLRSATRRWNVDSIRSLNDDSRLKSSQESRNCNNKKQLAHCPLAEWETKSIAVTLHVCPRNKLLQHPWSEL